MTAILSQAEYERLTPIERAQYWHERFLAKEEQLERTEKELHRLQTILVRIKAEIPS